MLVFIYSLGSSPQRIYYKHMYEGTFNRNVWLKYHGSEEAVNPRGFMAEYVRDHILRSGMPRQAVVDQLGQPDTEKTDCQQRHNEEMNQEELRKDGAVCYISYNLGMYSMMDYDTLDIYFDEDSKVKQVRIVQH